MAEIESLFIDNNNLIKLSGLRGAANGVYANTATVTVTIKDAATETEISGQTWPLAMNYIAASNGDYQATLDFDLVLTEQQQLRADVVADAGAGLRLSLRVPVIAVYRQGD